MTVRPFLVGVLTILTTPLACASPPGSDYPQTGSDCPPAIRVDVEACHGARDQVHAGLRTGGYSPPLTMQQAQQALSQQGRAGNPNYNIVDCHGKYVYSVNDR
jgi:hypothetical protein